MTAVYKLISIKKIRLGTLLSLIFFMPFTQGCQQKKGEQVSIFWEEGRAKGVIIPKSLLTNSNQEHLKTVLQIRLEDAGNSMLGDYGEVSGGVLFKPLVPLTPGKRYKVFYNKDLIGRVAVPLPDASGAPEVITIYPSADTLPENLLKIYLQFSAPMRESEALKHLHLLNENGDTVPNIFLDLQPELWNKERTTLTVWLDPGRIKRDLIPNQHLGNPLQKGKRYSLVIDRNWKDAQGLLLKQSFTKRFIVTGRDGDVPDPERWLINLPAAETTRPLRLDFKEALDYFLLPETIRVTDENGELVRGTVQVVNKERGIEITPAKKWQRGQHRLRIATYLEDLAGNNLNRPFDRDTKLQQKKEGDFVERHFVIEEKQQR
jgi:hypothetical protein